MENVEAVTVTQPTVKVPMMPLLLCVLVAAVLSVGGSAGAVMMLAKSGRLPLASGSATAAAAAEKPSAPEKPLPTHAVALDSMLVNLADTDAKAYLRVSMMLQVEDPPAAKEKKAEEKTKGPTPEETALRDSALEVLGRERSADLLEADGKTRLKQALRARFASANADVKVKDVLFTDFLVQR